MDANMQQVMLMLQLFLVLMLLMFLTQLFGVPIFGRGTSKFAKKHGIKIGVGFFFFCLIYAAYAFASGLDSGSVGVLGGMGGLMGLMCICACFGKVGATAGWFNDKADTSDDDDDEGDEEAQKGAATKQGSKDASSPTPAKIEGPTDTEWASPTKQSKLNSKADSKYAVQA